MKPIAQKDLLGCGVACTAIILKKTYTQALQLFPDGKKKAGLAGFLCRDIVEVLEKEGFNYIYKHNKNVLSFDQGSIVYIKKSSRYPGGHYLCLVNGQWMDPWINFPSINIKADFRKKLPGIPQYVIKPIT